MKVEKLDFVKLTKEEYKILDNACVLLTEIYDKANGHIANLSDEAIDIIYAILSDENSTVEE